MSQDNNDKPLGASGLKGPVRDFADYCEGEKMRRMHSGQPFDPKRFDLAVDLVLRKLKALEVVG